MPQDPTYRPTDVRMKGFARRWTVQDCLAWIDQQTPASVTETVALADANATADVGSGNHNKAMTLLEIG